VSEQRVDAIGGAQADGPAIEDGFPPSEGDAWFQRNRDQLDAIDPDRDLPMRMIAAAELRPRSIVELGCTVGHRLEALRRRLDVPTTGVDISPTAIDEGRHRYPQIEFHEGRLSELPLDRRFDLVIVNFVLCVIGRESLLPAIAEIDRVVADGGHLLIGDFLPDRPSKVPYHHRPGVWTFKQDYAAIFTTARLYEVVEQITGSHSGDPGPAAPEDRIRHTLLRRSATDLYEVASSGPIR
jgi:SAM-dependent methyltransferase